MGAQTATCTACRVSLYDADEIRGHYRSDLHRVNLKRKVSGMRPLSERELMERTRGMMESREKEKEEKRAVGCEVCRKRFSSGRALKNHENSKRHAERVRAMVNGRGGSVTSSVTQQEVEMETADVADVEEVVEMERDEEEEVENELHRRMNEWKANDKKISGVFDESWHESANESLEHMISRFNFFVPYSELLTDMDGLVRYLGEKVGVGYACVCCDRGFGSANAARRHMIDVGHCKMAQDWVHEFGEFYSGENMWRELSDGEEEIEGVAEVQGEEEEEEEDRFMTTPGLEDAGEDAVGLSVNGKVIGHRSLLRFYRQAAGGSADSRACVAANRGLHTARAIAWTGPREGKVQLEVIRRVEKRKQRFELMVGSQNYYCRKATFKQNMAVFNSGYRA